MDSRLASDPVSILVVDDHSANLIALEASLEPLKLRVVSASSGEEALEQCLAQDFALILMDVHMPGLDGYETVRMLRSRRRMRDVPIIFLTAFYEMTEHVHRGYALGAVDYVTKPFDPEVLRAKITVFTSLYARGRRIERERREETDRIKDMFLGAVGHDLRSPLQVIVMASRLMLDRAACSEKTHESHASTIERAAWRMNLIVDDILDLTRGKFARGIPLSLEAVDLGAMCRALVAEVERCEEAGEVGIDVSGDTRGTWDAGRIGRVVSNLVGNAVQHAPERRVQVRIVGRDEHVALAVHNDGPAIPEPLLPHVFEPFRRGDTTHEGLGLGLYIVREIVRAHGGSVEARSSDAEGTTFTVTLPRHVPERSASSSPSPTPPQYPSQSGTS